VGQWNLDLAGVSPALTLYGLHDRAVPVDLPRFDTGETEGGSAVTRGVPVTTVAGHLVTTVFDLLMAQYAAGRPGLPGEWPGSYDDPALGTPAWQERITSVPAAAAARVAREFARNAEVSRGRSMIAMGAGTNHWYHSDQVYRAFLTLLMLCGCQGVNGGGWAHYVGQEKVRPLAGWQQMAFALDWQRPPRQMTGTSYFYLHTGQWRYEGFGPAELTTPTRPGAVRGACLRRLPGAGSAAGLDPLAPDLQPQPAGHRGRRGACREAGGRAGGRGTPGWPSAVCWHGPGRPG
jgi:nitrate reductase / nitrite oxidoreductase, alpha subunit